MTVCETCGDEGFSQLLFYCLKCQIVAVHRYCMDGPPAIDDEEISWYCDECVPIVPKPPGPSRKYDQQENGVPPSDQQENRVPPNNQQENRVPPNDQQENRVPSSEQQENRVRPSDQQEYGVPPSDQQEYGVPPNDQQENGVPPSDDQQENGVPPSDHQENCNEKNSRHKQVRGDFKTNASDISQRKDEFSLTQRDPKCLNSLDDVENIRPIVLALKSLEPRNKRTDTEKGRCKQGRPIKKKEDLLDGTIVRKMRTKRARSHRDVEDEEVKLENNVDLEVADSVISKEDKHEKSSNEVDSKQATEHSDYVDQEPEVVEEEIVSVHNNKSEDVQSSCTIRKSCSPREKKRSLIIEMEYSDDDDTNNALTVVSPLKSSKDGEMFCASNKSLVELGSDPHAPAMMMADYNLTPAPPLTLAACVPYPPCSSQIVDHVPSQPVIDVIWRGGCVISNNINPTSFKLEAHVSNKASPVVYGAAIALPKIIDFEIISKRYAWPKSFKKSPPTGEVIGLYFFPVGERDEVLYQNLLAKMVDRQLMLMSQINNLELLVFCSLELPEEERRFQRKYYLWGVYRSKQETTFPMKPLDQRVEVNYSLSLPSDMSSNDVHQKPRDPNHRTTDNLNHPNRASGSQTSDTRLDRDQPYGSHQRRSYHHEFKKHRAETSYQSDARRRHYRIRQRDAITIRTAQNDSYRSGGRFRHFRGHERYD